LLESLGWTQLEVFGFFFSAFLCIKGCLLQVGALKWSHQIAGL
jgi:hypothetical protein